MKREDKIVLIACLIGLLVSYVVDWYLLTFFRELGLIIAGISVLVAILLVIAVGLILDAIWK